MELLGQGLDLLVRVTAESAINTLEDSDKASAPLSYLSFYICFLFRVIAITPAA